MSTEAMFPIFIGAAIKSVAVLAAAWAVAFLMRGRSAAARHLVWTASAAALLALPFLSASLPPLSMPGGSLVSSASSKLQAAMFQTTVTTSGTGGATTGNPRAQAASVNPASSNAASAPAAISATNWRLWMMMLWAAGAAAVLSRMLAGCIAIWRVRRTAPRFADRALSSEISRSLGIANPVDILESRAGTMPMTFGFLKPAVFMPTDAAEWTEERRRIVLLHELGHVRRGDVAAHLFARIAFALYWWNPLVWTAWREFIKERERATDDLVLNAGTRASDYAGHLLEVARTMRASSATGWAAIAMARDSRTRPSQLEGRLVAILDSDVNRKTPGRAGAWAAAAIAIAMVAPLAAVRAQDATPTVPADVDAYIRAALSQKNHEMLETAAKAAEQLQKLDTAQTFLQSAAAIRADVSGAQSVNYALGLLKLGDLEQKRNDAVSAIDFYTRAVNILGNKSEAVPALTYLGTRAIVDKNYEQAYSFFERIQVADQAHAGRAVMWMAIVRRNEAKPEEADALFKNALALQDPQSLDAANTMTIYAQFLRKQGRSEDAADLDARALAARKAAIQDAAQKPASHQSASPAAAFLSQTGYNEVTGKYERVLVGQQSLALPSGVYKIGGDVSQPALMRKVEPEYSELARIAQFQGSVALSIVVGTDGIPSNIQVAKPLGFGLDEKAVEAVSKWQFKPGVKDGQPVPVFATIEVNFRLL
jgi:TonB family protein